MNLVLTGEKFLQKKKSTTIVEHQRMTPTSYGLTSELNAKVEYEFGKYY